METEQIISDMLNCLWAQEGKAEPERFKIGVSWRGWLSLGGQHVTGPVYLMHGKERYEVEWVSGLPDGKVCLLWQ
jgi:hypothetical protein